MLIKIFKNVNWLFHYNEIEKINIKDILSDSDMYIGTPFKISIEFKSIFNLPDIPYSGKKLSLYFKVKEERSLRYEVLTDILSRKNNEGNILHLNCSIKDNAYCKMKVI